jgi:hypothetical protein
MRIATILGSILSVSLVCEVHSLLRLSTHLRREDPAEKEIKKELDDAGDSIAKHIRNAGKGPGWTNVGDTKKPMMDRIEVTRTAVCWARKNLIEHEACMTWMVDSCKDEVTGEGYCRKLRKYVKVKCRRGNQKGCDYAMELGVQMQEDDAAAEFSDGDEDGDGVLDADDAFPNNPLESKDSDGDNIGDNGDKYPEDASRAHEGEKKKDSPTAKRSGKPVPSGLDGSENVPLPSQGFNEHSTELVAHDDRKTMTADWHSEWPMNGGDEETSIKDICADNPNHAWCKLQHSKAARKAYAASHP